MAEATVGVTDQWAALHDKGTPEARWGEEAVFWTIELLLEKVGEAPVSRRCHQLPLWGMNTLAESTSHREM